MKYFDDARPSVAPSVTRLRKLETECKQFKYTWRANANDGFQKNRMENTKVIRVVVDVGAAVKSSSQTCDCQSFRKAQQQFSYWLA